MRVLPGPTKSNQVLAWSPDGRWLAAGGSGDGVAVWDVDAGTPGQRVLNAGHGGRLMQFCRATGRLFVAFQSGGFWHWDPATGAEHWHDWSKSYHQFHGMVVGADGRSVVINTYHEVEDGTNRHDVVGYTVADGGTMTEAWARPDRRGDFSHPFALRRDTGELFGVARDADYARRFEWGDAETGTTTSWFAPPDLHLLRHCVLSPGGERVAYITERALCVRALEDGAVTLELPAAEGEHRRGLAWAPDGRVISYTVGTTVRLLDADTLNEVRALDWNIGKPRAVAFNPDGLRAAVSGDGGRGWVTVFDLE